MPPRQVPLLIRAPRRPASGTPKGCHPILQTYHILGLKSLAPLKDFKLHFQILLQGAKVLHLNGGMLHKDVRASLAGEETIPLGVVEPLDLSPDPP